MAVHLPKAFSQNSGAEYLFWKMNLHLILQRRYLILNIWNFLLWLLPRLICLKKAYDCFGHLSCRTGAPTHGLWPIHNRAVWAMGAQIILHKWWGRRTYTCRQPAQVELCARMCVPACHSCKLSTRMCRPAACAARFPSPPSQTEAAKVGDRWSRTFGAVPPIISMVYIFLQNKICCCWNASNHTLEYLSCCHC